MAKKSDLSTFRHAVSILKKKGIVKPSVNVRTAYPSQISEGKSLKELVKKFDDVVSGKAEAVKLPKEKVKAYRKAGYETAGDRVFVPKLESDKVSVTKEGEIKITDKRSGVERIKKAVPYHNLKQWLEDMQKNTRRIDAMKRRNEFFGYKIAVHTSWNLYRSIEFLLDEIINGSTSGLNLSEKLQHTTRKQQNEFFESFEIVRVPRAGAWPEPPTRRRFRGTGRAGRGRKPTAKRQAELRDANAERQRKYREGLTNAERKIYKRKAKKRAKKARKKSKRK